MNNSELRKMVLKQRDKLTNDIRHKYSLIIFNKLRNLKIYQDSDIILCYANIKSEVETLRIIKDALLKKKIVALPKVMDDTQMNFYIIKNINELQPGYQGILEPSKNLLDNTIIKKALMIIPGTVFDENGNRLGYGKGYYDRFIAKYHPKYKIGLSYDMQIKKSIKTSAYDQKMDLILTEKAMYTPNTSVDKHN